jgi:hypothetical protein
MAPPGGGGASFQNATARFLYPAIHRFRLAARELLIPLLFSRPAF